jgi:hypothetical protein
MMRAVSLIPIVIVAGVPVLIHPSPGYAAVAAVAAAVCAAGAFLRWRPLVTAGGAIALIQYTVALTGLRASLVSAVVLGVSLALVLDVSEFFGRFHGAELTPPVLRRQARHWIAGALLGAFTAIVLAGVGALVRIGGPPALPPLLAAVGALATAAGVAGAVWRRRQESG